jgi:hypothetical protein
MAPPSLHRVPRNGSPASPVLWDAPTPDRPSRRASLPSLGDTLRCACGFAPGGPGHQTAGLEVRIPAPTSGHCRREAIRASQGSRTTHCPFALFFDPGRTEHARPSRRVGMAPAMSTTKAPTIIQLSRLNRTASGLAVYASSDAVTRTRRKTRFRPLAKRYRTGLVTRRVVTKGF